MQETLEYSPARTDWHYNDPPEDTPIIVHVDWFYSESAPEPTMHYSSTSEFLAKIKDGRLIGLDDHEEPESSGLEPIDVCRWRNQGTPKDRAEALSPSLNRKRYG